MKVVFFRVNWWNPKAAIIGLATASAYCHAALILDDGRLLDASESRGDVDYNDRLGKFGNKQVLVYDVPYESTKAVSRAISKIGSDYGWKGIWGWGLQVFTLGLLKINNAKNMYCFEFVLFALSYIPEIKIESPTIFNKLFLAKIDSDDLLAALERAGCPVIYEGKAKDYPVI